MRKIAQFTFNNDREVTVNHDLCQHCSKNDDCTEVCIAVETLVQLCKVKDPIRKMEYLNNIGGQLDLENSFTAKDL